MRPMLATAADPLDGLPRDGERWAYEVKWDGMRVLAMIQYGRLRLYSRTERDITPSYPELAALAAGQPDVVLDGEIVVLANGIPSFAALADRMHVREARRAAALAAQAPATLVAFDVLELSGISLTARPWRERRQVLEGLSAAGARWQLSPVHEDLDSLLTATLEHGLEGVVAKRRNSRYRPGARSSDWVKLAHRRNQTCVIGGWRPETSDASRIGALLLGIWVDSAGPDPVDTAAPVGKRLRFAGRVGSGLVAETAQVELHRLLRPLKLVRSPFDDAIPREDALGTTWVQPEVVVEVRHLGHTDNGRLRQPVFRGIRTDIDPADVRDE
jgi:bifunctional non-homologous end joining protein LigD